MTDLKPYILKLVPLRFRGVDMSFDLSHALFSSNDIDTGSRLLLKAIAKNAIPEHVSSILDIGSGTGVLGIACAKAYEGSSLLLRDRDALATEFSMHNARKHRLKTATGETALFLEGLGERRFDLVLCNVPAKAGTPVLDAFLRDLPGALTERGMAGIVVVNTIAPAALASIQASGSRLIATEEGSGHTTFMFMRPEGAPSPSGQVPSSFWTSVERTRQAAVLGGKRFQYVGYYGLPEFDTPSFATELASELCEVAMTGAMVRRSLVVNPGAGWLACYLRSRSKTVIDLCGRDELAHEATRRNLALNERPAGGATAGEKAPDPQAGAMLAGSAPREFEDRPTHSPVSATAEPADYFFIESAPDHSYDLMLEIPDLVPGVDPADAFWKAATRVLKTGAAVVVSLPSTAFERLERKKPKGFTKLREKKKKGFTAAAWRMELLSEDPSKKNNFADLAE